MKVGKAARTPRLSFKLRGDGGSLYRAVVLARRRSNNLLWLGGFPTADKRASTFSVAPCNIM